MPNLTAIGEYLCVAGLLTLVVITIGDAATPTVEHVDVLALAMAVSGAILARSPKA